MKITAPAKINLYLHITGKRDDGYHLLDSLFAFTEFGDELTITESTCFNFYVNGPYAPLLTHEKKENNLVYRAAMLLKQTYSVSAGANILLTKYIPVAAGLGGGSSDAATVLIGLNQLWNLQLSNEELASIALKLGADIPACIYKKTALVSGIGEKINIISENFNHCAILLVNPNQPLSTQAVFQYYHQHQPIYQAPINYQQLQQDFSFFQDKLTNYQNDLELSAKKLMPEIDDIIQLLNQEKNAVVVRMSGSGPTCFALFSDQASAKVAQENIQSARPNYWSKLTYLS